MTTLATPATPGYITATVSCRYCAWRARLSGETVEEVGEFLRRRLRAHVAERHDEPGAPS